MVERGGLKVGFVETLWSSSLQASKLKLSVHSVQVIAKEVNGSNKYGG